MNTNTSLSKGPWIRPNERRATRTGILLLLLLCLAASPTSAQTYTVLHNFNGSDGAYPSATLALSDVALYGTAMEGGISNNGTLFKINTDGSGFTVLKSFTGSSDGALPLGRLVLAGTTLYGTTQSGGMGINNGGGTVFKINTDGTGFTLIHSFTYGSDAFWPEAGLLLSGTTLYGTTELSGVYAPNYGTVFKVNIDGSGYQVLKTLGSSDGANPRAELILSGTALYGTTSGHEYPGNGTIFKLNTDGTGFAVLKELSNIGGCNRLYSPLALSGTTLYGMACEDNFYGTVFMLNTDGTGFAVLKTITNNFGAWVPGLIGTALSGATLYGTSGGSDPSHGSTNHAGTVFQINTDGSGFVVLKNFAGGSDGANPAAGLVLSGTVIYGTTSYGGTSNSGVIFSLGSPPTLQSSPRTQTAEAGSAIGLRVKASGSSPLFCLWYLNSTNLISCSTNCELELPNVYSSQSGAYTVVISNALGAVTSAPVMLNVIAAVERRPVPSVKVTGETASLLNVDYASALSPAPNWTTLGTVSLTSTSQYYFDLSMPLPPQRFYRAWQTGTPGVMPSLDLHLVPAITLTGNLGDSLRLDYINQFGPTDAWVTLATVTLTNTSQLYFDVSAPGQPQRLYRIVPLP